MKFSGSYDHDQVEFLVKVLPRTDFVSIENKEKFIQTGAKHYSQMLSLEKLPSDEYIHLFNQALSINSKRMAIDCLVLASKINSNRPEGMITLVSLLRAGTPVGVITKKILEAVFKRRVAHFSISIMRDIGIDINALSYILQQDGVSDQSLVFVDGWTGKGVIAGELTNSIARFNAANLTAIDSGLYVVADIAGKAKFSASYEDYLIPSCILNATVSGLVSRTVCNEQIAGSDFHGSFYYADFSKHDKSKLFVKIISDVAIQHAITHGVPDTSTPDLIMLNKISDNFVQQIMEKYSVNDKNLIKPGIGEATRVLLRRIPKLLIVKDVTSTDVAHLVNLVKQKSIKIAMDASMPYQAVSLIGSSLDG
jgi:hypothetical protein